MKKRILVAVIGFVILIAILGMVKALQIKAMINQGKKFVPPRRPLQWCRPSPNRGKRP